MPKNLDLKVSTVSTLTFGFLKDSDGKTAGEDESLKFTENKVKQFAHNQEFSQILPRKRPSYNLEKKYVRSGFEFCEKNHEFVFII